MLRLAIRRSNGGNRELRFAVHVRNDNQDRTLPLVRLKAVCGPGDDGEPMLAVRMPEEAGPQQSPGEVNRLLGACSVLLPVVPCGALAAAVYTVAVPEPHHRG